MPENLAISQKPFACCCKKMKRLNPINEKHGIQPLFSRCKAVGYSSPLDPRKISMAYPSTSPMAPIMRPTFSISFCLIMPVACASALGGVLMGSTIARDEPRATPTNKVSTPPMGCSVSRILIPAMARMGTNNAAVAVCEIKFAMA